MIKEIDISIPEEFKVSQAYYFDDTEEDYDYNVVLRAAKEIKGNKLIPNKLLAKGIDCAKERIMELQQELGIKVTEGQEMRVAILPSRVFDRVMSKVYDSDMKDTYGLDDGDFNCVLVNNIDDTNYGKSSTIYHELIHRFIERKVYAFGVRKDKKGEEIEFIENRKDGAIIEEIVKKGKSRSTIERGYVVNELGNHLEEIMFTRLLLEKPEFVAEKEERDENLKKRGIGQGKNFIDVKPKSNMIPSFSVRLTEDQIHFTKENKLFYGMAIMYSQLAYDLEKICDPSGSGEFRTALLRCKFDPSSQNVLRKMMDSKLGNGFYTRLKNLVNDNDQVFPIIKEVQKHLYPDLK